MNNILFNFDFTFGPAALLSVIPALLNIALFFYTLLFIKPSNLKSIFLLFVFFLVIFQVCETAIRLSSTVYTAMWWAQILSVGFNLLIPFAIHFLLIYTNPQKWEKSAWVNLALYIPALLFAIVNLSGISSFAMIQSDFWGMIVMPTESVINTIQFSWIAVLVSIMMGILIHHTFMRFKDDKERQKQSALISTGFAVPVLAGIMTQGIFPLFMDKPPVPLAPLTLTLFSVAIIYAIKKYKFLEFSPLNAWETIIRNINEGLLIMDNNGLIRYVNSRFCEITGYNKDELAGRNTKELLSLTGNKNNKNVNPSWLHSFRTGFSEIIVKHKTGRDLHLNINGFPYFDDEGKIIGSVIINIDKTQLVHYEEQLADSEMRSRAYIDQSLSLICFYHPESRKILYANKSFFSQLGYNPNDLGTITIHDLVIDSKEGMDGVIKKVIAHKSLNLGERQWRTRSGNVLDVLVNLSYIQQENDAFIYVSATDITARKMAEKELIESEERFSSLVQTANDAIVLTDDRGNILLWNKGGEDIFGYSKDDALNKNMSMLFAGRDACLPCTRTVQGLPDRQGISNGSTLFPGHINGSPSFAASGLKKNGLEFPAEISVGQWKTRSQDYYCYIIRDVSERKKMEQELKRMSETLSNIFKSLDKESFWSLDTKNNKMLYISPGTELLYGRKTSEFVEDPMLWKKVVYNEDLPLVEEGVGQMYEGKPVSNEFRIMRPDGSLRWVRSHIVPFINGTGKEIRRDGVIYDITENKKLEEQLQEKIKELNMFVYRASHDLRGPLASIMGLCNIGKQEVTSKEGTFYLDNIHKSIVRMDNILSELTQISQVSQNNLEVENTDLTDLTVTILESIKYIDNYNRVKFELEIQPVRFHTDKTIIRHILQNLIINGINYRDDLKPQPMVKISAKETGGNEVEISVTDNGIGIPEKIQPHIYDMFYRGNESSKGTGLGLYIVKNGVAKLKGKINCRSKAGEGTEFILSFPQIL
ncbi:MAG: PAS domain S-box protein [Bacteroidetes bacterium]|nr:PAS domain S-box protein [Bacteroidota bacterium]